MAYCRNCGAKLIEGEAKCSLCDFSEKANELEPIQAPKGLMIAMWIFCILGGLIGIILSSVVIGSKNADGAHKYIEKSRSQAKIGLAVAIAWFIISIAIRTCQ